MSKEKKTIMNKTFNKLLKGDVIYEVDLSGNLNTHQITQISYDDDFIDIKWNDGFCLIAKRYISTNGYGSFFVVYEKAVKLANARKKYELKHQIEHYQNQIDILKKKLNKATTELKKLQKV